MPLSKVLYHTCFICRQRCKWWSRRPKLTSSVISDVKPIICIFTFIHCSYLDPVVPLPIPMWLQVYSIRALQKACITFNLQPPTQRSVWHTYDEGVMPMTAFKKEEAYNSWKETNFRNEIDGRVILCWGIIVSMLTFSSMMLYEKWYFLLREQQGDQSLSTRASSQLLFILCFRVLLCCYANNQTKMPSFGYK